MGEHLRSQARHRLAPRRGRHQPRPPRDGSHRRVRRRVRVARNHAAGEGVLHPAARDDRRHPRRVRVAEPLLLLLLPRAGADADLHHDWRLGPRRKSQLRHLQNHHLSQPRCAHRAGWPHRALHPVGREHLRHRRADQGREGPPAAARRAVAHLPAAAFRVRHPRLALAVPHVGATRLRRRADRHRDAPRGRAEEVRTLRPAARRHPAHAGWRVGLARNPRLPLPRQHRLLRPRRDAAEEFEPAHRQLQRRAHGLHLPRHREPEPCRRDRRSRGDGGARLPRRADLWPERRAPGADRHAGDGEARRAAAPNPLPRCRARDGAARRLRPAGLRELRG